MKVKRRVAGQHDVGVAHADREKIDAGGFDKRLRGLRIGRLGRCVRRSGNPRRQFAELGLDRDAALMSVARQFSNSLDILFVRRGGVGGHDEIEIRR